MDLQKSLGKTLPPNRTCGRQSGYFLQSAREIGVVSFFQAGIRLVDNIRELIADNGGGGKAAAGGKFLIFIALAGLLEQLAELGLHGVVQAIGSDHEAHLTQEAQGT